MDHDLTVTKIQRLMAPALRKKLPKTVAVVLIDAKKSATLNAVYHGKRKATNVLSFRYDDTYGEILICPAIIRKEAKEQGNAQAFQMTWMIVHGMLHLAGVHHEKSARTERRAKSIEENILRKLAKRA